MQKILIFSGTSEGRQLARQLADHGKSVTVCVATEYGQEVMAQDEESPWIRVQTGRLDAVQMEEMLREENWDVIVDATHPFALEVSENIAKACAGQKKELLRLLREEETGAEEDKEANVTYVDSAAQAAACLNQSRGNIFLTTGSKELAEYVQGIQDISRLYVRILPNGAEVEKCRKLGLKGKQIICMQGPFSTELNMAMIHETEASILVTKETSQAGGFAQKLQAASQTGIEALVIRRPREAGYSMREILKRLGVEEKRAQTKRQVILAGMGMGNPSNMTREVYQACQDADMIIGAARMLETVKAMGKPVKNLYQAKETADYIKMHTEYRKMVVLLSGDVGFYSGARKLREEILQKRAGTDSGQIEEIQIHQLCGVPSVVYFASRIGLAWEDLALMSLHGRQQNLIGIMQCHGRVFALTEGAKGIRSLSRELLTYGFSDTEMYVGYMLSYPQEEILQGKPADFLHYGKEGVSAVIMLDQKHADYVTTPGIPDQAFLRGQAPMTKEEVRSVSLSKLALAREAVVYDIGAGTGSVAVECARQCINGTVYAIEKNAQALELLRQNKIKHRAWNLEIISGEAPEALSELPVPTHAFVGGSGGRLMEIASLLWEKNPGVRLVLNVISLETLQEVIELMKNTEFSHKEIVQISVAKAKELGRHHLMMGQNPVYVITLQK